MDNNELIGRYLFNQMTPSERKDFEEQLKTDKALAEEVEVNKKIIRGIQQYAEEDRLISSFKEQYERERQHSRSGRMIFIRIAAVTLLLIVTAWLLTYFFGPKSMIRDKPVTEERKPRTPALPNTQDSINNNLLAREQNREDFSELSRFETLINQVYRSGDSLRIISPKIGQQYKKGDVVIFQWHKQGVGQLNLVIFNNKGEIINEHEIPAFYKYKNKLKPGLYYWQLETSSEAIYVGKFCVE